jgi:hypothetical protein
VFMSAAFLASPYWSGMPGLALMEALERAQGTQRASDSVGALFDVDLDGFKAVNDQAGHAAGRRGAARPQPDQGAGACALARERQHGRLPAA